MDYVLKTFFRSTKKLSKNVINYLIGNYLSEELEEDQIELIDDYAQCTNIYINLKFINDMLENQNIPISILYGHIGVIKIYFPLKKYNRKLLFEIHDLELSFGPSQRTSVPDTEALFGSMMESMITMQKNIQQEDFSNLMFQEDNSGKNVNAFISKLISNVCFRFEKTRINFESLPFQHGEKQSCRFICDIGLINMETKNNNSESIKNTSCLGILLQNEVEISDVIISWEVAVNKSKQDIDLEASTHSFSSQSINNTMLYGAQIMSMQGLINIKYTLMLNSQKPEFEINCQIQQINILLAPLQIHWLQLMIAQCTEDNEELVDPSLAKNVKMTSSQFESFFPNNADDRSVSSHKSPNFESIYYETSSSIDNMSSFTLDDVPLDNSDDEDNEGDTYENSGIGSISSRTTTTNNTCSQYYRRQRARASLQNTEFTNDQSTCASLASNFTVFDRDGGIKTDLKVTFSVAVIAIKLLHQNPKNDFMNYLDYPDDQDLSRQNYYKKWRSLSREFFNSFKQKEYEMNSISSSSNLSSLNQVRTMHHENVDGNYFSIYSKNSVLSFLNKKLSDDAHKSFEFSSGHVSISEVICKTCSFGLDTDTLELLDIRISEQELSRNSQQTDKEASDDKAVEVKCEYGVSSQSELTLQIRLDHCEFGVDLSLQDRLKPLLQNDLLLEHLPQSWSSSSLGANTYSFSSTSKLSSQDGMPASVSVINIGRLAINIHVPIVNLINEIPYYWQSRMLHQESIRVVMEKPCRIITKTSARKPSKRPGHSKHRSNEDDEVGKDNTDFMVEVYSDKIDVSLYSESLGNVPILIVYNERDDPIPIIHIKNQRVHQNIEDVPSNSYFDINDSYSSMYNQPFTSIVQPSDNANPHQKPNKKKKPNKFQNSKSNNKPYFTKDSTGNDGEKIIYEPCDGKTIYNYIKNSIRNSMIDIEVKPTLVVGLIQDKGHLQVLYNRLCFDLVLWESNYDKSKNDIVINCQNIDKSNTDYSTPLKKTQNQSSLQSSFAKRTNKKLPKKKKEINWSIIESDEDEYSEEQDDQHDPYDDEYDDEEDEDEKTLMSDNKEVGGFKPKKFTLTVNVDIMKLCLKNKKNETVCWLENAVIFTDSSFIFDSETESESIVIISAETARIFQAGNALHPRDLYTLFQVDLRTLQTSHNPVMIPQHSDFFGVSQWNDGVVDQMFWLIMDTTISSVKKSRQKRCKYQQKSSTIFTGTLDSFCIQHKYYHTSSTNENSENTSENSFDWLINLSELLAVDNPIINGYTMPDTDTLVHLHLKNGCADLNFTNSPLSMLAFVRRGQVEFSFNTTESYWLNCAIELSGSQLFIRHVGHSISPYGMSHNISMPAIMKMGYIFIADLGNLDLKFSKIGIVDYDDNHSPVCKLELTNTELNLHLCNDSLQLIIAGISALLASEPVNNCHRRGSTLPDSQTESFSTKTLGNLSSPDLKDLIADAMCEMTMSDDGSGTHVIKDIGEQMRSHRPVLESIFDDFLLVTEESWLVFEQVRNVDSSSSMSGKLSVKQDHFKQPNIDDQYFKLNRLLYREGMPKSNPLSSCNGPNSLILHDFSIGVHLYAGRDFNTDQTKLPTSQRKNNTSTKSGLSEAQKKERSRMTNSMNVKFQRFVDSPGANSSLTASQYNSQGDDSSASSITISTPSSEYDVYFGGKMSIGEFLKTGGYNRKLKECYNLKLCKIYFRYDDFNEPTNFCPSTNYWPEYSPLVTQPGPISRRLIFLVNAIEIESHNHLSQVNKNLYTDVDSSLWQDPKAPMLMLRMIYFMMNPDEDVLNEECDIKLSIQPIRLNIDQEFISFCEDFYQIFMSPKPASLSAPTTISTTTRTTNCKRMHNAPLRDTIIVPSSSSPSHSPIKYSSNELKLGHGGGIDSITGSSPLSKTSTARIPAFDEVSHRLRRCESVEGVNHTAKKMLAGGSRAVFIRSFELYPDVSVRLDYNGTRVDFSKGMRGLLYILMQLNNVVIILRRRKYQEGITGFENLVNLLMKDLWEEVYGQLSNILTRLGPMAEISDILSGIYDLFNLPYQHYRSQASLIEGIKLGTRSITTNSLWAGLTLISKGLKLFQKMAETTYEFVSPPGNENEDEKDSTVPQQNYPRRRPYTSRNAIMSSMASPLEIARQMPAVIASPVLAACGATGTLVDDLRYQLRPNIKQDDELKWKLG